MTRPLRWAQLFPAGETVTGAMVFVAERGAAFYMRIRVHRVVSAIMETETGPRPDRGQQ
jgi:hypothetical protein